MKKPFSFFLEERLREAAKKQSKRQRSPSFSEFSAEAYCAGVNRTGCDPVCTYNGGSALVGPDGTVKGRLEGDACARTFTIDTAETARLRAKFCTLG